MSDDGFKPYIEHHPGDLITAEDWNGLQINIQADMQKRVQDATNDVLHGATPVDHALNADKFDNKTPKNWTDGFDERYAFKVHDHEGMASYRRYFRRMDKDQLFVVLDHKLGRFPLVDVYQLLPITIPDQITSKPPAPPTIEFFLYYGHEELDLLQEQKLVTDKKLPRKSLSIPWERLLQEHGVKYEDDDSLGDVINDFLDAFFKLPAADDMDYLVSKWIDDHRDGKTIGELKHRGEWDDMRWLMLPRKVVVGESPVAVPLQGSGLEVIHFNYDTLAITIASTVVPETQVIDLMILLRS